ncbi:flagellar basal body rod protein FlgF [Roseovarius aquimarinus]|uniref:Flagellar basal-body rod protein FlgF n=1 Tax=Roseovarius aquimarinus TaxID=1229156 RepID=A0ABW7I594_9RHOB
MDRMIYTALNALRVNRDAQVAQAQNLANQTVPGFRRDLPNEGASKFLTAMDSATTRAFQLETGPAPFSEMQGALTRTDEELDVAISGDGYFFVQPASGEPALSRRGDLRRDVDGTLRDGAGAAMLGPDMAPITLPAYRDIRITDIGEIYIRPVDEPGGEAVLAGVLATVIPPEDAKLTKGADGHVRGAEGTALPPPDQRGAVLQGTLEGSNVNPVEELLGTMELQRRFEMGMRMMLAAREIDESGARVMQAPEG